MAISKRDMTQTKAAKKDAKGNAAKGGTLIRGGALVPQILGKHASPRPLVTSKERADLDYSDLENVAKSSLKRIEIGQFPKDIPNFKQPGITKDTLVTEYLRNWIVSGVANGTLTPLHLLPRKAEIAKFLGVSVGTVQNAIRYIEDDGLLESKQRIGTMIRGVDDDQRIRKQTSKRDQAVIAIKKLIVREGFTPGEDLPSAREISHKIGSAPNTTRLALEYLAGVGLLENRGTRGNKANWGLLEIPEVGEDPTVHAIESETLIDQLERDLKTLISQRYQVSDKLPSHLDLANLLKTSIKTVHDAMKRLADQGIVSSKRGRYGTYVLRTPDSTQMFSAEDAAIFIRAEDATFYNYEKVEGHLKQLISRKYKSGQKLPAMGVLAEELGVSSNTIRKALLNLGKQGIVSFARGRYGGTFVKKVPKVENAKALTWVSINPETIKTYHTGAPNKGGRPKTRA